MPIDPVSAFQDAVAAVKPSQGPDWAMELANKIDGLVTGKAQVAGITGQVQFQFNKAIFAAQLALLTMTTITASSAQTIASAWGSAMTASIMTVPPSSFLGASAPPTTWSVVITSLIDPPSVMAAQSALMSTLAAMQAVPIAKNSVIGPALRTAFSMCTCTVNGLSSVPPPAGPTPLIAPMLPLM